MSPTPDGPPFEALTLANRTLGEVGRRLLSQVLGGRCVLSNQLSQVLLLPLLLERGAAQKDLMPLPLPTLTEDELDAAATETVPASSGDERSWSAKVWLVLGVHALNSLYEGRQRPFRKEVAEWCRNGEPNAAQRKALTLLDSYVRHFLRDGVVPDVDWASELKKVHLSYTGEEVKTARMLCLSELRLGLPPAGAAASIKAAELADEPLRSYLLEPRRLLRPEAAFPAEVPRAKVFAEDADWVEIVRYAVELGVLGLLRRSENFRLHGQPLLNGAFAVSKGKVVDGVEVCRLIINLIPLNLLMGLLEGDIRSLPYGGQWSGIMLLPDDQVAVFSDEDLTCAFYLFEMEEWMPFQALNKSVSGSDVKGVPGVPRDLWDEEELFPAVRVLAMGHSSACGILQHLHRK